MAFLRPASMLAILALMSLVLIWIEPTDAEDFTQVIQVKYKRSIYLQCSEKTYVKKPEDEHDDDEEVDDHDDDKKDENKKDDDKKDDDDDDYTFYKVNTTTNLVTKVDSYENKYVLVDDSKILIIKSIRRNDIESEFFCNSSKIKVNFKFQVIPFLFFPHQTSYSVNEGSSVKLNCKALYGFENGQKLHWHWYHNGKELDATNVKFTVNSDEKTHESELSLESVPLAAKGVINCTVKNDYGYHSRELRLRVRGSLAWLWPSLGVVAILIVLVIVIFTCEAIKTKRDKSK